MSLFDKSYRASNNGRLQNVGLSICSGKEPYGFELRTTTNGIKISGKPDAIDGIIPYVARALMNYTLDTKKNCKP
jgi:hypothetical protein